MDLGGALQAAVRDSVKGERSPGVLFSGGLDSSVLAFLAKEANPATVLYAAGTEGSDDLGHARKNAEMLGMQLREVVFSDDGISRLFAETVSITGESSKMKLELGLVLLALCKKAGGDGVTVLLSGTGAEELFLGYNSHAIAWRNGEDLGALREKELAGLRAKDLARSEKVASHCGVRLALPFLDARVVAAALGIPAESNFAGGENKAALRGIARGLGLPEGICGRRKRAMQYGSGVHARLSRMKPVKTLNSVGKNTP